MLTREEMRMMLGARHRSLTLCPSFPFTIYHNLPFIRIEIVCCSNHFVGLQAAALLLSKCDRSLNATRRVNGFTIGSILGQDDYTPCSISSSYCPTGSIVVPRIFLATIFTCHFSYCLYPPGNLRLCNKHRPSQLCTENLHPDPIQITPHFLNRWLNRDVRQAQNQSDSSS